MEFKKAKVSKRCNVTIEEDRFAINDLDGTERLVYLLCIQQSSILGRQSQKVCCKRI